MHLFELQTDKITFLADPDGVTGKQFIKGTKSTYTYPDGEKCTGHKRVGTNDELNDFKKATKKGYFSLAWSSDSVWVIFSEKTWKTERPVPEKKLREIQQYASDHDIPKKYLSKDFIDHYTN